VIGIATPPVGPCMRALLPGMVEDAAAQRGAYALDSAAVELTWVSGPPLVLLAGTVLSTGAALVVAGAILTVSTLLFAATNASRAWRPEPKTGEDGTGALRSPGVRTLVLALGSAGLLFGATEVAVTAAADALGGTAAAGPLLGLWGVGSLIGGIVVARAGGGARTGAGLAALLAVLAATHLALAAAAGSMIALGAVIVLAGSMIAPTCATAYAMVDAAAPAGTTTEAFAWLATAIAIGTSAGAAAAGAVADVSGPAPTFVLAGVAGALGAAVTILRAGSISPAPALAAC
jgi:predicted MFS family arabinose efflux permease